MDIIKNYEVYTRRILPLKIIFFENLHLKNNDEMAVINNRNSPWKYNEFSDLAMEHHSIINE